MQNTSKPVAIERLRRAIARIDVLLEGRHDSPDFDKWLRDTEIALAHTFGEKSRHVRDFKDVSYSAGMVVMGGGDEQFQRPFQSGLLTARSVLLSMIDEVEEFWNGKADESTELSGASDSRGGSGSKAVFIVHGHDEGAKETVARFLSDIGLSPVILHEKPNVGRTIIEKFEDYADVAYAVAILSPDEALIGLS